MLFYLLLIPFTLQGLAMFFDEFYYHRKRGLPLWEILGHPADTVCFLACFLFLKNSQASVENAYIYMLLTAISCLIVTKDELIHCKLCSIGEMWLHSVLFILHSLTLISAGVLWWFAQDLGVEAKIDQIFLIQCMVILAFMSYQILYWTIPWKRFYYERISKRDIKP